MYDIIEFQNEIIKLLESESYTVALIKLDEYIHIYGKDAFYFLAGADAKNGIDDFQAGADLVEEAVNSGINDILLDQRMAESLIGLEKYEEALEWLQKEDLDQDAPEMLHSFFLMGRAYAGMQQFKKAVSYFENILLEVDDPLTLLFAGICYLELGNEKRASESFKKICTDQDYLSDILDLLCEKGLTELFLYYLDFLDGGQTEKLAYLAEFYLDQDDLRKFLQFYAKAVESLHVSFQNADAEDLYYSLESDETTGTVCKKILQLKYEKYLTPELDVQARLRGMDYLEIQGREAEEVLYRLLHLFRGEGEAILAVAEYTRTNEYNKIAREILFENRWGTPKARDEISRWNMNKAAVLLSQGQPEEALTLLKADHLNGDPTYRKLLAAAKLESGIEKESALQEAWTLMPDGMMAILLFLYYTSEELYENAENVMKKMDAFCQGMGYREAFRKIPDLEMYLAFVSTFFSEEQDED